jgi:hypothetical protein
MKMIKVKTMVNNDDINWFLLKRNKLSFLKSFALFLLRTLVLLTFTTPVVI